MDGGGGGGGLVAKSCLTLVIPWTCQAPLSMGFSRQEYWSGLPFPSPGDLPNPGIESRPPTLQVDSLPAEPKGKPKNTGMGNIFLLWRIFLTQRSNPGLPYCRQIVYQLSQKGSPRILEWVAYPFPSRSSWPRNQTGVSCIAGRFFTNWAMREALEPPGKPHSKLVPKWDVPPKLIEPHQALCFILSGEKRQGAATQPSL